MADDFFQKWGVEQGATPDVGVGPTKSYSDDFNTKWLGEEQPSTATPIQTVAIKPQDTRSAYERVLGIGGDRYQLWPERLARAIAPSIAQGLTAPGEALKSTPESPVTTEQMVAPAANLAGIIGTGALPSVYGPATQLIDPAVARLANLARETYGIPIRGGQLSQSESINYLDALLKGKPSSGYGQNVAEQHAAFNRGIAQTIGEDAEKVTPEVMANAKERLGQNYDNIAENTRLKFDEPLNQRFKDIIDQSQSVLAKDEHSIITGQIQNVLNKVSGEGEINGAQYKALITRGSPLDRATKSADSNVRFYAGEVKQALIDAMERHAPDNMLSLLRQTNSQYKAMKTIEPLVEKSPTGDISPPLLMGAVRKSYPGMMAYGGQNDLANLARIGQRFLKEPPQSGTQPRMSAAKILGLGGAGLGALGGEAMLYLQNPGLAAKAALIGGAAAGTGALGKYATTKALGSVLRSDWYANRLINSALPGTAQPNLLQKLSSSTVPYLPPAIPALPFMRTQQGNPFYQTP